MPTPFKRLSSGLDYPMTIVTAAASEGERAGCLVGFTTQCSMKPSRWWVGLSKLNRTYDVALRAGALAVHFPTAAHRHLALLFGEETGDEVDKFARCDWSPWPGDGVTPLLDAVPRHLVGGILDRHDAGDHMGFVVDVADVAWEDGPQLGFQSMLDVEPGHPVL